MTNAIDPVHFRQVMGRVPTCVTVVTALVDDVAHAMVIGSFVSVSLDPPLAGFFCTTTSESWQGLRQATALGVNVLAADQAEISNACMRPPEQRLDGVDWEIADGAPKIAGTAAWIALEPYKIVDAGDHELALCTVTRMELSAEPAEPLVHFGGAYRYLLPDGAGDE